ncbi:MAG: cytochrome c-type biogenesis protein CcmH [Rhizobiaceae bacterium]|nr:cytochrome c-type biogenesis protein CcmH [Rhizobiaceae bacterium]
MSKVLTSFMALIFLTLSVPAFAVNPDEILDDAELEARARVISADLRCLVCQNQSIDDSDADLARDLRVLVRNRLVEGDTNKEVIDYVVSRYGDFVLLKPSFSAKNLFLWIAPALFLLIGGLLAFVKLRNPDHEKVSAPLSSDEKDKLKQILNQ